MADQKISADPSASDLVGAIIPIVQGGLNKKADSTLFQAALGFTPENVANKDTDGSLAANSDTKYASQKAVKTYADANLALAYGYTDSAIAGSFNYRGTYDGSSGNFPTTGGRGVSGVPAKGDAWEILSACTIQSIPYDQGDIIVAKVNTPGQTTSNWGTSEHNTQQATTSMRGTAMVVDTTTIQTPGTTDDQKMVTAVKFWQGVATLKGQTNTWATAQTFSSSPIFSSVSASQYLKVDGSKALISVASIPDSDLTYANQNANKVWAGPSSGGAAAPTFRSLVTADLSASLVTYAKIQNVTDARLLGNASGGATAPSEISVSNGLTLASSALTWGGALTASTTITSNTANWVNYSSTFTATANNQYARQYSSTLTSRATASDAIAGDYFSNVIVANSTSIDAVGTIIDTNLKTSSGIASVQAGNGNVNNGNSCAGMTPGTYTSVSASSTSGTGTGALFTVIVATATTFTSITKTTAGSGYNQGETISFNGSIFGGSGSISLTILSTVNTLGANSAALRIIHRLPDNPGMVKRFIDFQGPAGTTLGGIGVSYLSASPTTYTFILTDNSGSAFLSSNSTSVGILRNMSLGFGMSLTVNNGPFSVVGGSSTFGGTGSFTGSVNVQKGFGSFAGTGGTQFSFETNPTSVTVGVINTVTVSGSATNGTYNNVSLTGGTGTGAQYNITVSGGVVTAAVPSTSAGRGTNYTVGDVLSGVITGGTASITVATVDFSSNWIGQYYDVSSFVDAKSQNNYVSCLLTPTYNITSTQVGAIYALRYAGVHTALGSFNQYSFVYENSGSKGGIGNASPLSTWDINGSLGVGILTSTGNLTVDATHHTIIITSGTGSYTLPSASGATRRIYVFINQTGTSRTISTYKDKAGSSQITIAANAALWLQTDGSNWYQIN